MPRSTSPEKHLMSGATHGHIGHRCRTGSRGRWRSSDASEVPQNAPSASMADLANERMEIVSHGPSDHGAAPKLLLSPTEAAHALGIGRTTLYQLLSNGELASVKIGALRRVPVAALEVYISRHFEPDVS